MGEFEKNMDKLLKLTCFCSILSFGHCSDLEAPDLSKVNFYLWTRYNPFAYVKFDLTVESLSSTPFNPDNKVVILVHGWNSDGDGFGNDYAPAFLEADDYNVIAVDWGDLETWANYPQAAARSKIIGEYAADLIGLLTAFGDNVFDNIHLIGHSLGAHAVGFMGKKTQEWGLGKLKRITGLDPALPFFELADETGRIDKSDAEFVDIVHVNSGWLWEGCLSFVKQLGHVDFYPAGGSHQPGCIEACIGSACFNITVEDLIKGGCSHSRANYYYAESLVGGNFLGWKCDGWDQFEHGHCCSEPTTVLGEYIDKSTPEGKYYMHVNENSPYSQGSSGSNWCQQSR